MGYPASSTSTPVRRFLPFAAAPAAVAGIAAAIALGNTSSAAPPATADAAGHLSTAPAVPAPQATLTGTELVSITRQAGTGLPVVRLNANRVAAVATRGKHHRTLPASYTVQSGDTLASIAQRLYQSADYWPALYSANHGKIKYANEIQAGQVLAVPAKPAKIPAAPKVLDIPAAAPAAAPAASSTATVVTQSAPAPTQTATTYSGSTGSFQACVISRESGGNSQVMNGSGHYGLYQFSASTWAAYGGNPADFGNASVAEQNQVFASAMAAGGESNWAPYDGC